MDRRQEPAAVSSLSSSQSLADFLASAQPTHLQAATIAANLARYLISVHSGGGAFLCLSPRTVIVEESLNVHLRSAAGGAAEDDFAYRAPEQLGDGAGDWRSDCWSVGAIFYRLYTGQAPFRGATRQALEASILSDEPAELPVLAGSLAAEVDRILRRALAKEPAKRYGRITDLVADLNGLCRRLVSRSANAGGVPAAAEPPMPGPELETPRPREDLFTGLAEKREKWARGEPPTWWSVAALPAAALFVIVAMLLYCGRPEVGSAEHGGNASAAVEGLQDSRSLGTFPTAKESSSPNIEGAGA